MSDALGKATFLWGVAAFLWWLGARQYGGTIPAVNSWELDRLLMREVPYALVWGWFAHAASRRVSGESSFAEVAGLTTALIVFGVGQGVVNL